ncbi:MAG: glycosyltransferase family 39 protein [Actinomycetota bacterium]|nr:glycosyltransferase family 39 protein [Actinomycetota bacterium]
MSVGSRVGASPLRRPALESGAALGRIARAVPWPICLVTAAAAALRFAGLGTVGPNEFYDAAVRSMSGSLHDFVFGAFDPGGLLSIDKPPIDLWLQVISVKLFGWGSWALKLPEALAGTLAVPLLYDAVRRAAGRFAGLGAALVLAVLPESVLTSRSDTMDSVMALLVIAALWLTIRAVARGERRALVLAGVALGLAFEVKLLEALVAAPGLLALHWLGSPLPAARKLRDLAAAGLALVASGLAWVVLVSLAPGHHPWAIGPSDGSIWKAMFVFNGVGKVTAASPLKPGGPGPLRMLVSTGWHADVLFGCGLLAAAVIALAGVAAAMRSPPRQLLARCELPLALALATAVWLLVGVVVFDLMRTVHARYLEALAPAVAIATGYGAATLASARSRGVSLAAGLVAMLAIGAYTFRFRPPAIGWSVVALTLAACGAALLVHSGGALARHARWLLAGLVVSAALLFPAHEALLLVRTGANDSAGLAATDPGSAQVLSRYLMPRTAGQRYELAVDEPLALAPLVIRDDRPILPLTSFGGIPLTSLRVLLEDVRAGRVRYGLVGAGRCRPRHAAGAACGPAALWIRHNGVEVTPGGLSRSLRLYVLPGGPA